MLPICRWWLDDILKLAERFAKGETAYAIAGNLCESLASLVYLKGWIAKAGAVIAALAREWELLDAKPPSPATRTRGALALACCFPSWPDFTHPFSRTFYPNRFPLLTSHTILTG